MTTDYPINDDFPDGLHEELARIVIEFGRIEYLIKLCIKDVKGEGFDAGMGAAEKINYFGRLCENTLTAAKGKLTDDGFDGLQQFIDAATEMSYYRNDSLHAYWTMHDGKVMRFRPRWDGEQLRWDRSRAVTVEELTDKADEMRRLHDEFDLVRRAWSVRQVQE